jgi:hypothetical protein
MGTRLGDRMFIRVRDDVICLGVYNFERQSDRTRREHPNLEGFASEFVFMIPWMSYWGSTPHRKSH